MKELVLNKRKLKINIDGVVYIVSFPTMGKFKVFRDDMEKDGADDFDLTMSLLDSLGLPKDAAMELEPSHLELIMEEFSGQKKS